MFEARCRQKSSKKTYFEEFKREAEIEEPLHLVLDELFGDLDSFNSEADVLKELQSLRPNFYLDEIALRKKVLKAMDAMRLL